MNKDEKVPCPQLAHRHAYSMINDQALSLKAKGLWMYMIMKPPGWDFAAERIARETKDRVSAIRSAWDELEYLGYMTRKKLGNGRVVYKLFNIRCGEEAPFLGDYDFEISEEISPWREDCPSIRSSEHSDAPCTAEKLANHLIFAYEFSEADAWGEAREWAKACTEASLPLTWFNARAWADRIKWKYEGTQSAKIEGISI